MLLEHVAATDAPRRQYIDSIVVDNCLKKRSVTNRKLSARHLSELYGLDPSIALFRLLRYFWERDQSSRPQLALLCACARDSILHHTMAKIGELSQGSLINQELTEQWIEELKPGRFSPLTLSSIARNINSTWTQAGYLTGKAVRYRTTTTLTAAAVAYGLFLAYVSGHRGEAMLQSAYVRILSTTSSELLECAAEASQRGWLSLKRIASVVDISFPEMLSARELEYLREQN